MRSLSPRLGVIMFLLASLDVSVAAPVSTNLSIGPPDASNWFDFILPRLMMSDQVTLPQRAPLPTAEGLALIAMTLTSDIFDSTIRAFIASNSHTSTRVDSVASSVIQKSTGGNVAIESNASTVTDAAHSRAAMALGGVVGVRGVLVRLCEMIMCFRSELTRTEDLLILMCTLCLDIP